MDVYDTIPEIRSLISRETFVAVCEEILATYKDVPYHNREHALDVMSNGVMYLRNTYLYTRLTSVEKLTFVLGLLGHDASHPGIGNKEEYTKIIALFPSGTKSCMEEFHYGLTCAILRKHHLPVNLHILHAIIGATDPFLSLEDVKKRFPEHLQDLAVIVRLADVNHVLSSFENHIHWSKRITDEIGCMLTPQSQIHFIENHILPLVEEARLVFMTKGDKETSFRASGFYSRIRTRFQANLDYWKQMLRTAMETVAGSSCGDKMAGGVARGSS